MQHNSFGSPDGGAADIEPPVEAGTEPPFFAASMTKLVVMNF